MEGLARRWECVARFLDDADDGRRGPHAVARERGLRRHQLAGILAAQLSPDWRGHADELVLLVERYASVHSIIAAGEAHSLLRYVKVILRRTLTHPDAVVPWHSPVREAYEREVLATAQAAEHDRSATWHAELDERSAAAATERAGDQAARRAARAVAAAAGGHEHHPPRDPDDTDPAAAARAVHDRWPPVAQPGQGLPAEAAGRRRC